MIKATYTLDAETVRLLERMSRRWGVSKSEALRRAIRASAVEGGAGTDSRLGAPDRLQQAADLSASTTAAWARKARAERRAGRTRSR